jgi:hypothetical protein
MARRKRKARDYLKRLYGMQQVSVLLTGAGTFCMPTLNRSWQIYFAKDDTGTGGKQQARFLIIQLKINVYQRRSYSFK